MFIFRLIFLLLLFSCNGNGITENDLLHNARTAFLIGENVSAENLYKQYLQFYPTGKFRYEAWERIYDITVNLRNNKLEALPILDAMQLEFSNDKDSVINILELTAKLYSDLYLTEQAIETWEKYIRISQIETYRINYARLQLSRLYNLINKHELSFKVMRECRTTHDENHVYLKCQLQEAQLFLKLQQVSQASEILENLITKINANSDIYFESNLLLAEIYELQNDNFKAKQLYQNLLIYFPENQVIKSRLLIN